MDWGDIPTWGATAGAFLAVVIAARALRIERAREDARLAHELASQASRVAAWTVEDLQLGPDRSSAQRTLHLRMGIHAPVDGGVIVRNVSEVPVYAAEIILYNGAPYEVARIPIGTVAPGERRFTQHELERHTGIDIVALTTGREVSGRRVQWHSVLAGVAFHDAANHRWERDYAGRLVSLGPGGPPVAAGRAPGLRGWLEQAHFMVSTRRVHDWLPRRRLAPPELTDEERNLRC